MLLNTNKIASLPEREQVWKKILGLISMAVRCSMLEVTQVNKCSDIV